MNKGIRSYSRINRDASIFARAQAGDVDARNAIVEANLGIAGHLIARMGIPVEAREEARQVGALGIMRAIVDYQPDRGAFTTYCGVWIRSFVGRWWSDERRDGGGGAHVPVNARGEAAEVAPNPMRLDGCVGEEGLTYLDLLAAEGPSPEELADTALELARLRELIRRLPTRERQIMRLRSQGATLEQIGRRRGCTRERIRQLEVKAMAEMKAAVRTGRI